MLVGIVRNKVSDMAVRPIFDFEINAVLEAAEQMFIHEDGKGDNRQMYQRIYCIMKGVTDRADLNDLCR